jgi:NADH-quinone oxidoreductase subunit M
MLHAGVLKKFGLYGLIRIAAPILPDSIQRFMPLLLLLLVCNILYVGYITISQRKLDWMLGYSSVMHMGYIFLGFAAMNEISLTGASLMLVSHGLTIALLFALCGEIRERTGTLDFSELGGIARATPKLGLAFGFAAMASMRRPHVFDLWALASKSPRTAEEIEAVALAHFPAGITASGRAQAVPADAS